MMIRLKRELQPKNLLSYVLACILTIFITIFLFGNKAFAELHAVFNLSQYETIYSASISGSSIISTPLTYKYWKAETIKGNQAQPTSATFSKVATSIGTSNPAGAQYGVYKIVSGSSNQKTFLDWYSESVAVDRSVTMNYSTTTSNLYTEMAFYANTNGVGGSQSNVSYDKFAYTSN
ncbi:hypothetical protein [Cohnella phaseoli]|uniref:Uncharacterized protein n=1 Tax=Cohnella phaseoli TaxID=456490 RepID=A0A3D9JNS0_9BACL|nr:hypothetical protein [Cohnella phaseoli]RED75743.1 hypothetical protein DFP98_114104 [Cohnella phaseoli]